MRPTSAIGSNFHAGVKISVLLTTREVAPLSKTRSRLQQELVARPVGPIWTRGEAVLSPARRSPALQYGVQRGGTVRLETIVP